jgi:hypothetical protein
MRVGDLMHALGRLPQSAASMSSPKDVVARTSLRWHGQNPRAIRDLYLNDRGAAAVGLEAGGGRDAATGGQSTGYTSEVTGTWQHAVLQRSIEPPGPALAVRGRFGRSACQAGIEKPVASRMSGS